MRLAQLARKISKKPAEIVDFLASQGIQIEASSNAKVTDEHASMVLLEFAKDLNPDTEQEAESQGGEPEKMPELLPSTEGDKPSPMRDMEILAEETSTVADSDVKIMEMASSRFRPRHRIDTEKRNWDEPSAYDAEEVYRTLGSEGFIGLQIHPGNRWSPGGVVRYRNISLQPLG